MVLEATFLNRTPCIKVTFLSLASSFGSIEKSSQPPAARESVKCFSIAEMPNIVEAMDAVSSIV